MKCPYRPVTRKDIGTNTTITEFDECYYSICPWYVQGHYEIGIGEYIPETCQRCHLDYAKVTNERNRNTR